jgi:hypothetical protein
VILPQFPSIAAAANNDGRNPLPPASLVSIAASATIKLKQQILFTSFFLIS